MGRDSNSTGTATDRKNMHVRGPTVYRIYGIESTGTTRI